jgi:hypothetical protein
MDEADRRFWLNSITDKYRESRDRQSEHGAFVRRIFLPAMFGALAVVSLTDRGLPIVGRTPVLVAMAVVTLVAWYLDSFFLANERELRGKGAELLERASSGGHVEIVELIETRFDPPAKFEILKVGVTTKLSVAYLLGELIALGGVVLDIVL